MGDGTKIEWTDATANVINGCSLASPGCINCYAMRLAGTRMKTHPTREGLTKPTKAGPVWTGEVRFHEPALQQVLRWQAPRMIFWNAHGDMFHENVPDEWIDRCFAVMALTPQHTHQVLTKRSARMRKYLIDGSARHRVAGIVLGMMNDKVVSYAKGFAALQDRPCDEDPETVAWPLPNVWLGVSVEDQVRADERIPDLLATPAAVRWISAEPLLGPVNLGAVPWDVAGYRMEGALLDPAEHDDFRFWHHKTQGIQWVVVGGESGPSARPMHPTWARSLRDQCADAGVPFLFKQWGEHIAIPAPNATWPDGSAVSASLEPVEFRRVGKKAAGRLLDGVQHDGYPEVAYV